MEASVFCRSQLLRQVVVQQIGKGIIELHGVEPSLGDEAWRLPLESPDGELASQEQMTRKGFIIGAEVGQMTAVEVDLVESQYRAQGKEEIASQFTAQAHRPAILVEQPGSFPLHVVEKTPGMQKVFGQ